MGGCGKTQAVQTIAQELKELTLRQVVTTEEPSRKNREKIFALQKSGVAPMKVVEAFYDDRVEVINGVVRPALKSGKHAVSNRGFPCTHAYEGALGASRQEMIRVHKERLGDFTADWIFYLALSDSRIGLARKKDLQGDPFDQREPDYFVSVAAEYAQMARENFMGKWVTVDADKRINDVQTQLRLSVLKLLHDTSKN